MGATDSQRDKPVVIVTGSSGLLGTAVIHRLASRYQLIGFDRDGPPYPPIEAECISVDVTDAASIYRGLERVRYAYGNRIASVVHLAAYYDFSGEASPLYEKITIQGTQQLLQALERFQVEQLLFSSTMLVHQPRQPGQLINEDSPLEGKWAYPQSKIDTEALLRHHHKDIPIVLMRIAGVYTDTCDSIPLAHQIQRIYEKRLTAWVYPGDVTHGQAFVHLDDTVEAITQAIDRRQTLPAEVAFLIGEPETYSYDQLQRTLAELIHGDTDWQTREIPRPVAKTGAWLQDHLPGIEEPFIKPWMIDLADDHYALDIRRARTMLGWEPCHRLLDTLPRMVQALLTDPVAWYQRHQLETPADIHGRSDSH
jgi:nucleoside-diphosphate-sugar epimerase